MILELSPVPQVKALFSSAFKAEISDSGEVDIEYKRIQMKRIKMTS
jgi:hypothetical protein